MFEKLIRSLRLSFRIMTTDCSRPTETNPGYAYPRNVVVVQKLCLNDRRSFPYLPAAAVPAVAGVRPEYD